MAYLQEIETLQRWIKQAAGLNSMRLQAAPPKVARPVILWETDGRPPGTNLSRWVWVDNVTWYGKLYAASLDQLLVLQEALRFDLEEKAGVLPVLDGAGNEIAKLKNVQISFGNNGTLDVPIEVRYLATYSRTTPPAVPAATYVGTKITTNKL
jgi:hypothetical protein